MSMPNYPDVSHKTLLAESSLSSVISDKTNIRKRVALIYFNAGGGHLAAALALQAELSNQYPEWEITLIDLFKALDPEEKFRRMTGFAPEAYYNKRLATGFTFGLTQELKVLQALIRMSHKHQVAKLNECWLRIKPSMVVSLVPNFNRAIGESIKLVIPTSPFVTVMTDMSDFPPHFWVERGYTQHLICGTDYAVKQALLQGIDPSHVYASSGMILSPRFYDLNHFNRSDARALLGFDFETPVGLVMFGGHGAASMIQIAKQLSDQPLIFICGRNEKLRDLLSKIPTQAPRQVVGFTDDVAYWMKLADYFIGKPGPASITEALHCELPVIVTRNAWTLPQERWNADWVTENNIGRVISSFKTIRNTVEQVIQNLDQLKRNVRLIKKNRALYEVVQILGQILIQHQVTHEYQMVS